MHATSPTDTHRNHPGLSPDERSRFDADGWIGNFPLLSAAEAQRLCALWKQEVGKFTYPDNHGLEGRPLAFEQRPWFKSMHVYIPEYFALTSHPSIVERVASVLGPDLIAWGVTTILLKPGQAHRWHVDLEHVQWPGVSVFIGVQGNATATNLKVITRSHRVAELPQKLGVDSDAAALTACRARAGDCSLEVMDVKVGEFSLFDGRLWHGSGNTTAQPRIAIIAQYARPDASIGIPLNWDDPIRWHPEPPPCVLVRGRDTHGINRIVDKPLPLPR